MKIVCALSDGAEQVVDAPPGSTVMQAALEADVPGIVAECGGNAMCATCHVVVDADDIARFGAMSEDEDDMLDCTAEPRTERSRLSCQLITPDDSDTVRVAIPGRQR